MQIHQLQDTANKMRKRVGRGGKRGTTAGRGMKGQKSRSGGNVKPLFEGGRSSLVMRMKKNRGFKSPHSKKKTISLDVIDTYFADGDIVTLRALREKKLIRTTDLSGGVRLVAGSISKKVTVEHPISLSSAALSTLEKAGGSYKGLTVEKKESDQK